jgi:hypothetical protein
MKRILFVVFLVFVTNSIWAQFVDLGLPSGTKWKAQSESQPYTFDDAIRYFDGFLPTSGQFQELIANCTWRWTGSGYKVTGKNGNSIYLSASVQRGNESLGVFWSRTSDGADGAYGLLFYSSVVKIDCTRSLDNGRSVILCIK